MAKRKKKDYNSTVLVVNTNDPNRVTFYDKDTSRTTERTRDWLDRMTNRRMNKKNK